MTAFEPVKTPALSAVPGWTDLWRLHARYQIETVALLSRRAAAYLDVPKTVTTCQSVEDVMREQVLFWQRAQIDYQRAMSHTMSQTLVAVPSSTHGPRDEAVPVERTRDYLVVAPVAADPVAAPKSSQLPPVPEYRVRRSA